MALFRPHVYSRMRIQSLVAFFFKFRRILFHIKNQVPDPLHSVKLVCVKNCYQDIFFLNFFLFSKNLDYPPNDKKNLGGASRKVGLGLRKKYSRGGGSGTLHLINQSGATALQSLQGRPSLQADMGHLLHASLAAGTWSKYASGWNMFTAFESHAKTKFSWPLEKDVLRGFAVFCISVVFSLSSQIERLRGL